MLFALLITGYDATAQHCEGQLIEFDSCFSTHFSNGLMASQGPYFNGKKHGEWYYYAENGQLWMKVLFIHGRYQRDANYLDYSPLGVRASLQFSSENTPSTTQLLKSWTRHLILYQDITYPLDLHRFYTIETTYRYRVKREWHSITLQHFAHSIPQNELSTFAESGLKFLQEHLWVNFEVKRAHWTRTAVRYRGHPYSLHFLQPNNPKDTVNPLTQGNGQWQRHYEDGTLKECLAIVGGQIHGQAQYFDEDGRLWQHGHYQYGKRTGIWERYHPNGSVAFRWHYMNGELNGDYASFYRNGQLKMLCHIEEGKLGSASDGSFTSTVVFDGMPYQYLAIKGTTRQYDKEGKLVRTHHFAYPVVFLATEALKQETKSAGNTSVFTGTEHWDFTNGQPSRIKTLNHRYDVGY